MPTGPAYESYNHTLANVCNAIGAAPGSDNVRGSDYLRLRYGFVHHHLWRNFAILVTLMITFATAHLVAAEYIPAQRSKGDILPFLKGPKRSRKIRDMPKDEEDNRSVRCADILGGEETEKKKGSLGDKEMPSVAFHWQNVNYQLQTGDGTKDILTDMNGWVEPGSLTALMVSCSSSHTYLSLTINSTVGCHWRWKNLSTERLSLSDIDWGCHR